MKQIDARAAAWRKREPGRMSGEIGGAVSNALTQNITHHLAMITYET